MASQGLPRATFAAVGDVHGAMHAMVRLLAAWEREHRRRLDFVLQVGDFEPHRDERDLETASIPEKYRDLGDFADFHAGRATFAWPVHFIGGNHEPYGYLDQFPSGGELVPNCRYLGRVGRATLAGLTVVSLTGIYAEQGLAGRPPLETIATTKKKLYTYYTQDEVDRALGFGRADVLVLHEWPRGAIDPARIDLTGRHRARDPEAIGSETARALVESLRPKLVVAGHMHWPHRSVIGPSKFAALGHIDTGPDALGVFEVRGDGSIVEIAGVSE